MPTITCDRCDRKLDIPESKLGTKVECPFCGDVNVVPAVIPASGPASPPTTHSPPAPPPIAVGVGVTPIGAKKDRASALGLPPDDGPERRVMRLRPAMMRARPGLFFILMAALLGGVVASITFAVRSQPTYAWIAGIISALAAISFLVWKVRTLGVALEITNKRTVETRGLFSRATSEVLHDDIKNLQITQTFLQRIWGVGEIGISSAGQSGIEIHTKDIPRPMEVRRVIDAYRDTLD